MKELVFPLNALFGQTRSKTENIHDSATYSKLGAPLGGVLAIKEKRFDSWSFDSAIHTRKNDNGRLLFCR